MLKNLVRPIRGTAQQASNRVKDRSKRQSTRKLATAPHQAHKSILICKKGHEVDLAMDTKQTRNSIAPHCNAQRGWVEVSSVDPLVEPAWTVQSLIDVFNVSSSSGSSVALAQAATNVILPRLQQFFPSKSEVARRSSREAKDDSKEASADKTAPSSSSTDTVAPKGHERPTLWDLHPIPATGMPWQPKVISIGKEITRSLEKTQLNKFRYIKRQGSLKPGDVIVQCFMKTATTLSISITPLSKSEFFWEKPVPWPAGFAHIAHEERYPAESYKKCKEILHHMDLSLKNGLSGKTVVELGATPGGWTMVLLEAGATVTSVDWADLTDPWLTAHEKLKHMREDARIFDPVKSEVFAPGGRVDYVFADLAMPPAKSMEAFDEWLKNKWSTAFAWTFKLGFHTGSRYAAVTALIRERLDAYGPDLIYTIRHLYNHENEIVVLGGWKSLKTGSL